MTPPTNDCPLFWFSWGSHCYYFSNRKVDAVQTWYDAQFFCEETAGNSFNSTLASINSREENRYITNTLITLNLIGPYVWIGLSGGTGKPNRVITLGNRQKEQAIGYGLLIISAN